MNRRMKVAIIWLVISLLSFTAVILAIVLEIDPFSGGGAMIYVGLILGITSIIVFFMYLKMARREAHIANDAGSQIVKWDYTDDEWERFAEYQYKERIKDNKGIWMVIAVISAVCILPIWFLTKNLPYSVISIVVLLAFLSIFIILPPAIQRIRILRSPKTAIISDNGIRIGKELALFDFKISWLDSITVDDGNMTFIYSAIASPTIVQSYNFRVPVKEDSESDVDKILGFYSALPKPPKITDNRKNGVLANDLDAQQPGA